MRLSGILHLYRVRLRVRLVQEALAVIGIAVGVGLLFASQVVNTSLNGSVHQLTRQLVGNARLQVQARDAHGFSEGLVRRIQDMPGVMSAAPVLETQANLVGPGGSQSVELIGADPRFVHLGGALLRRFSVAALARQRGFALPAPIAQRIGVTTLQPVELQIAGRTIKSVLGVTLQEADVGALVHSPVALAPLAYAQTLAGMRKRLTRVFVQPYLGHDAEVRRELERLAAGGLNVEPAQFDSTVFDNAASPTNQSTELFAVISALVGFLFAFNAMLLTTPARRALIADLRLDGYGPGTVIQVLMLDAVVLAGVSAALGLLLGEEISLHLFHGNPGYLSFAFPVGSERIVTWQSIAIAALGGTLAAFVGVLAPVGDLLRQRRVGGAPPPRRGPRPARWSVACGGAALLGTTAILLFAPRQAVVGVVLLTVALLVLLPVLIRAALALVERLTVNLRATAPFIAVNELRSQGAWARTVAIAATGAVAVFGSVAIDGTRHDLERGLDASAQGIDSMANIWVTAAGESNSFATTPLRDSLSLTLARVPGVSEVRPYRGSFLDYDGRRLWVLAPSRSVTRPLTSTQFAQGSLATATARIRGQGWLVMSEAVARQHHLRIGQRFELPSPHPRSFRVAGLITNMGWPSGALMLNASDYERAWGSSDVSAYHLMVAPSASLPQVLARVRGALGPDSGLVAETTAQRERRHDREASQGLARLTQIRDLVLLASILAMAAAMGSMIWQRRPRLARLKLDGLTDLGVWRALLFESALLLGCGCSIGAIFGLYGQLLGSDAILVVTGFPVVFALGVWVALASLLVVSAVAVAITAVPGYIVARVRPMAGLPE